MYDVIIIGKGPAGLQAALYTARSKVKTLVLGKESVLTKAKRIDNYFSTESPSGSEMLETGIRQCESVGVEFKDELVVSITKSKDFQVITDENTYEAKAVIIATGQPSKKIPIKNIEKYEGKGIHYCTTCDGFFYQNMKIGILGYTDYAVAELQEMLNFTKDITLFTNGQELDLNAKSKAFMKEYLFPLNTNKIISFEGSDIAIESVKLEDGSEETLDGIFVAYGSASSVDFALKLGVMTKNNALVVDENQMTNIKGLYAAGDCTGGFKQISTAVGEGALAGKNVIDYIKSSSATS